MGISSNVDNTSWQTHGKTSLIQHGNKWLVMNVGKFKDIKRFSVVLIKQKVLKKTKDLIPWVLMHDDPNFSIIQE